MRVLSLLLLYIAFAYLPLCLFLFLFLSQSVDISLSLFISNVCVLSRGSLAIQTAYTYVRICANVQLYDYRLDNVITALAHNRYKYIQDFLSRERVPRFSSRIRRILRFTAHRVLIYKSGGVILWVVPRENRINRWSIRVTGFQQGEGSTRGGTISEIYRVGI